MGSNAEPHGGARHPPSPSAQARSTEHVAFGQRVDAPLQVHLKRKHWDPAAASKAAAERCKAVFLRQMGQAAKMTSAASTFAAPAKRQPGTQVGGMEGLGEAGRRRRVPSNLCAPAAREALSRGAVPGAGVACGHRC